MLDIDAPLIIASATPLVVGSIDHGSFSVNITGRVHSSHYGQGLYVLREATREEFIATWLAHGADRAALELGAAEHDYFYEIHTD